MKMWAEFFFDDSEIMLSVILIPSNSGEESPKVKEMLRLRKLRSA